jgi:hypothetical protein
MTIADGSALHFRCQWVFTSKIDFFCQVAHPPQCRGEIDGVSWNQPAAKTRTVPEDEQYSDEEDISSMEAPGHARPWSGQKQPEFMVFV